MSIPIIRQVITGEGGTPTQYAHAPLARELITTLGGTPTQVGYIGLLRELVTEAGGTPTQHTSVGLLRELVTALGGTPETYNDDYLWAQILSLGFILDPSAGYALYLPFSAASPTYRVGATTYSDPTTLPGYAYTRSGAKSELNSSGSPTAFAANVPAILPSIGYWSRGALTNLLLNAGSSSGLSTQSVTSAASQYTLSFIGTGTVTLSGTSTAGPLVGTGANDRVALVFTPTAGTLTLTVTGSVTYAGLILGNHPAGGPIIPTAGATASIGADVLSNTAFPYNGADTDFFHWVVGTFSAPTNGTSEVLVRGSQHWLGRSGAGMLYVADPLAPATGAQNIDTVAQGAGRVVVGIRRRAGNSTAFFKRIDGTVITKTETAIAWPSPSNTLQIGHYGGGFQPNASGIDTFAKTGTFSDAECQAIMAAA